MLGRISNIATPFLVAALCMILVMPTVKPWVWPLFWGLVLILLAHLALHVLHRRRLARLLSARLSAGAAHFMVATACHLDWAELSGSFDETTVRLLQSLVNQGPQDGRALKPSLEKTLSRLKRLMRRHPGDPGPPAYASWCLALLSRIVGKEKALEPGGEAPENRLWFQAVGLHERASALAGNQGSLLADWGRILEGRAESGGDRQYSRVQLLEAALNCYDEAAGLDYDLKEVGRGRGRVLGHLAGEVEPGSALSMLTRAVEHFEIARRDQPWPGDFYDEFGQVVYNLAQFHPSQGEHYFRYAARLFILAAELNEGQAEPAFRAGRALYQAAGLAEDKDPEQAGDLYRQALEFFKQAALADPQDAYSLMWSARCLGSVYHVTSAGQAKAVPAEGTKIDEARALLEEAASFCSRASLLDPEEEIFSEWANILSLQAELGGPRAGDLWADTARKYAAAAACPEASPDRAAINWHNWGFALACLAETRPSVARRRKLLREAARKYERAARLNGDNLITLKNWGDVLGDLAELSEDPQEIERYTQEAVEKFRRATELYPDQAGPWRRWSAILQGQARSERTPARRRELWQEALAKLEGGVRAEPLDAETWVLWGRVLSEICWEGPEYERPLLIRSIIEKYEKALSIAPDDDETWNLLGRVRLEASEMPEELGSVANPLGSASAAAANLKAACGLKPEISEHWAEWGRALFRIAQIVDNEASGLAALREAHEKYETAVALNPLDGEHHTGLGHILYQWGWRLEEPDQKRSKFKEAYRHCAEAGRLAPHDPTVWRNWGKVAEALANIEKDPQKSFDWQNEASEKYYHADTLEQPQGRGRRH